MVLRSSRTGSPNLHSVTTRIHKMVLLPRQHRPVVQRRFCLNTSYVQIRATTHRLGDISQVAYPLCVPMSLSVKRVSSHYHPLYGVATKI